MKDAIKKLNLFSACLPLNMYVLKFCRKSDIMQSSCKKFLQYSKWFPSLTVWRCDLQAAAHIVYGWSQWKLRLPVKFLKCGNFSCGQINDILHIEYTKLKIIENLSSIRKDSRRHLTAFFSLTRGTLYSNYIPTIFTNHCTQSIRFSPKKSLS